MPFKLIQGHRRRY